MYARCLSVFRPGFKVSPRMLTGTKDDEAASETKRPFDSGVGSFWPVVSRRTIYKNFTDVFRRVLFFLFYSVEGEAYIVPG